MKSSRGPWLAIALFATVPVFIVDLLTPSVVMIGLLQFVPILIATQTRSIDAVRLACGVGISLLILGGLLSSIDYPIVYVIANRLISLVGIVVVASWGVHVVKRDTSLRIELEESRGLCDRLEGKQEFFSKQRRALMSIMEDLQLEVSQRKQLEKSLRKTQFVVDHAHDVVLFVEYDGRLSYANEQARYLFGYQADTQMRIDPGDIDVTSADDDWPVYWDAIISMGDRIYNTKHRSKEGNVIECQARSSMLHFEGESLLVLFIRDVSDVKRAEAFRASLFERSTNPHLIFGDGGIIDCNHAATTILGFEDKQSLLKHHPA